MQPTITKMDARQGTVTVKMEDGTGREVEKTFQLTEDVEYLDSTGQLVTLDVFQSGDEVLLIETEGKIKEMKKHPKTKKPGAKAKMQNPKQPAAKQAESSNPGSKQRNEQKAKARH